MHERRGSLPWKIQIYQIHTNPPFLEKKIWIRAFNAWWWKDMVVDYLHKIYTVLYTSRIMY